MEIIKKYYRLWDTQCGRYMASGYNAKGKEELCEDYASYKSNDWDNDEGEMWGAWKTMSLDEKMNFIEDDEFNIESGYFKFKENND
jgi:hypothetical protein